jgi:hypothetical protein
MKPFEPGKTESITACLECAAVAETADSGAQQNEGAACRHPNGVCLCGLDCQVSASTQNQALSAIVFLYRHVLELDPGRLDGVLATQ